MNSGPNVSGGISDGMLHAAKSGGVGLRDKWVLVGDVLLPWWVIYVPVLCMWANN